MKRTSAKKKVLPRSRPVIYLLFNTNELGNSSDTVSEMDYAFLGSYATEQDAVKAWANHIVELDNDLESKYFSKGGKPIKTKKDLEKEGWKILWTEIPEGVENGGTKAKKASKKASIKTPKAAKKTKAASKKATAKRIDIKPSDRFSFVKEVDLDDDFDDPKENDNQERWPIYSITFPITRYEEFSHTLKFKKGVSEKKAIDAVEEYLSQPMTEAYWNKIKSDLDGYMKESEVAEGTNRGRAVGDPFLTRMITLSTRDKVPKSRQTAKGKRHVIISYEY